MQKRKLWLKFINKENEDVSKCAALCSQHFDETLFDKSEFVVKLLPNAIPTRKVVNTKIRKLYFTTTFNINYLCCILYICIQQAKTSESQIVILDTDPVESEKLASAVVDVPMESVPSTSVGQNVNRTPSTSLLKTNAQVQADSPRKDKLEEHLRRLAAANLRKDRQLRKLQKQAWSQKNRILELRSGIKELKSVIRELKKKRGVAEATDESSQDIELTDESVTFSDDQEEDELVVNDHSYAVLYSDNE